MESGTGRTPVPLLEAFIIREGPLPFKRER